MVAKLLHADRPNDGRTPGQADRHDEANNDFRNFANAPKNCKMQEGYSKVQKWRSTVIMSVERLKTADSGLFERTVPSEN